MSKVITHNLFLPLILFLVTLIGYFLFYNGEQKHLNYFVPLAEAFINGRLYLLENPSWLNELIEISGKYYVVYPPMPAIMLIPFVYLFGIDFPQPQLAILIAAINVSLSYLVMKKFFRLKKLAILSAILYGFGTMMWYHAVMGSAWYIAHILAMFFIWLALLELQNNKRYIIVGLLIGAAYWSRLPAILAIVFPLLYYREDFINFKTTLKINFRNLFLLGTGAGIFVGLNVIYNYLRFGVIYDISYQLLPVFEEPWYQHGLFNIVNIPVHLAEVFFALPKFSNEFPFLIPSLNVLALWFVTPALFLILQAPFKERLVWVSGITVLIMSLPGLMHGSNGFTQFGFRFALDYLPFLLILISAGMTRTKIGWSYLLVFLSILINFWGMMMLTVYKVWTL